MLRINIQLAYFSDKCLFSIMIVFYGISLNVLAKILYETLI